MKIKFLAISAFLITTSSFACPELNGRYLCESEGSQFEMNLTYNKSTNTLTINPDGEVTSMIMDNTKKDFSPILSYSEGGVTFTRNAYQGSCEQNTLSLKIFGSLTSEGQTSEVILKDKYLGNGEEFSLRSSLELVGMGENDESLEYCKKI